MKRISLFIIFVFASFVFGINANAQRRTSLVTASNNAVNWSEGDSFSLLSQGTSTTSAKKLVVTVNGTSQGIGLKVANTNTKYLKYDAIKVTVGGVDVTSSITSVGASSSNTYKLGVYNSNSKYQYAPAGTVVTASINNSNLVLPIVQSSSSSSISSTNVAVVELEGLKYSSDQKNWIDITSETTLSNGSSWGKSNVSYEWVTEGTQGANDQFTLSSAAGETNGEFSGTITGSASDCYAIYPYSVGNTFDGTAIHFTLPETQTYAESSFASGVNPSAGKYENGIVEFKNLCGVLALQLKGEEIVTSIELTDADGESLWGNATVDVANIGTDEGYATVTGGSSTVTLDCGGGVQLKKDEVTPFYFVVPKGAFANGLTAKINTFYGQGTLSTTKAQTIKRSVIKKMPVCGVGDLEIQEFNIENPAVAEYIANSTSTLSSTASNYSQSYFDQSRSYRPDQPNTKEITFCNPSASAVTITMATDMSYENVVLNATTTASSYTLRNFVPGNTYYYKVTNEGELLTAGALKATGQLRMVAVDKGFNMRDLGGWKGLGDKTVRYEQIYRGASLGGTDMNGTTSDITADDKAELYRIGMRAQLDLRAATNSGKYSGEYSYHSYSRGETTLTDADFNNTMTDYGAYNQDASVVSDVAWIIYELKRGRPVYFNCRQGADRTGTIGFIIEGLLGCYGNDTGHQMAMDYELTGFSQANLVDNKTVSTSYRGATEAYGNTSKLFWALLFLSASDADLSTVQEKCYYYLNKYWSSEGTCISADDLDWFIKYMLNMSDAEYTYRPSWAQTYKTTLQTIGEKKANVVSYK